MSAMSSSGAAEAAAAALPLPRPLPLPPALPRVAACRAITSSRAAAEAPFRAAAAAASLWPLPLPRPVATGGPSAGAGSGDLRLSSPLACWVTSSSASSAAKSCLIAGSRRGHAPQRQQSAEVQQAASSDYSSVQPLNDLPGISNAYGDLVMQATAPDSVPCCLHTGSVPQHPCCVLTHSIEPQMSALLLCQALAAKTCWQCH